MTPEERAARFSAIGLSPEHVALLDIGEADGDAQTILAILRRLRNDALERARRAYHELNMTAVLMPNGTDMVVTRRAFEAMEEAIKHPEAQP